MISSSVALKEWAAVVEALGAGEHLILLRKGGVKDPGGSFRVRHREFLLYPTWEHQEDSLIREEFRGKPKAASRPSADPSRVTFRYYAGVGYEAPVKEAALLAGLEKYHIWAPAFFTKRLSYRPEEPMLALVLRVYRLPKPVHVPLEPAYAGCRSWVPLVQPVPVEGGEPVIDNRAFRSALEEIRSRIR
jgi:hypothetical protein